MNRELSNKPWGGTFLHFQDAVCKELTLRGEFSSDWFASKEGQKRMDQSFHEGLPFNLAVSELSLWCKGWVAKTHREESSPLKLAKSVTVIPETHTFNFTHTAGEDEMMMGGLNV